MMEILENKTSIEERIFSIRGKQVILDRDLAMLYGVETKALNQAVKRNIERFPSSFMFQLKQDEFSELVTICDRFEKLKHSSVMPHAFTEQGVAMLSSVLRSPTAISVSITIMESFVKMRQFIMNNSHLFHRMGVLEMRVMETESQIGRIMNMIDNNKSLPKQGIFFDGQVYDAYVFVAGLVRKAVKRVVLIDNYIDETVLTLLDKRASGVEAVIYTGRISQQLQLDIDKHNAQYPPINVRTFNKAHDRFLIIDDEVYLVGASIKDLGKKWFGFTLMENTDAEELIGRV
ncbi:MAG: ORF6N domain-containing protein [Bacteroidales bacterium]|nr:ORF6N domain-containing protein [Bacteroidales bacterium]